MESSIDLPPASVEMLHAHLDYVLDTNKSIRLTAIHDKEDGIRLHILDSLLALTEFQDAPSGPALDIGTGGGYPGLPLAVATGRPVDLLDSVQKKARAIDDFLELKKFDLPKMSTIGLRAEELALTHAGYYSVILARAVSALPSLVELASPLLMQGGVLIAHKGPLDADELDRAVKVAHITGMKFVSDREYALPLGNEQRSVIVFEKIGKPEIDLPRRPGRAQRKPLA
jgi:16S rRNA (guanine527-N7)-methyltransferase